eukprot:TRINITY_DN9652_c0_g1_i21.p1 TRINITY_DN9652_c0_g1~~TRINITY_DN9652_c0_g1_i21.p1  ORF type:complete len:322 (+),score=49.30 TRINITY_DN9652_c0_g1_i21:129-1094(+)
MKGVKWEEGQSKGSGKQLNADRKTGVRTSRQILEHFIPFLCQLKEGLSGSKRKRARHKKTLSAIQTPKEKVSNFLKSKKGSLNSHDKRKMLREDGGVEKEVPLNKLLAQTHVKSSNGEATHGSKEFQAITSARIILRSNRKNKKHMLQGKIKKNHSITIPSTPSKQSKETAKSKHARHNTEFKVKLTLPPKQRLLAKHRRNTSGAINDIVEDIMKLKAECVTDRTKTKGLKQLTSEAERPKNAGKFLIVKRASAPLSKRKLHESKESTNPNKIKVKTYQIFTSKADLPKAKNNSGKTKELSIHGTNPVSYTHLTLPTNREV